MSQTKVCLRQISQQWRAKVDTVGLLEQFNYFSRQCHVGSLSPVLTSRAIKEKCLREGSGSQLREGRSSYGLRTLLRMRLENSPRVVLVGLSLLPLARCWRTMTRALNAPLCPLSPSLPLLPLASIQTLTNTLERRSQIQEQIPSLKYTYKYPG